MNLGLRMTDPHAFAAGQPLSIGMAEQDLGAVNELLETNIRLGMDRVRKEFRRCGLRKAGKRCIGKQAVGGSRPASDFLLRVILTSGESYPTCRDRRGGPVSLTAFAEIPE